MYIDKMIICNNTNEIIIREIVFRPVGLNLIIGETGGETRETNGVGKTTIIECIRYLLGGKLPDRFRGRIGLSTNDVYVILDIVHSSGFLRIKRSINSEKYVYLSSDSSAIFSHDNWDRKESNQFSTYIESIVYDSSNIKRESDNPSFSAVKEYLFRNEKKGFGDIYLPDRKASDASKLLSFLSLVPSNYESLIGEMRKNLKSLKEELSLVIQLEKEVKRNKKAYIQVEKDIQLLSLAMQNIDIKSKIEYDISHYAELKEKISSTSRQITYQTHVIKQFNKNIDNIREKSAKANELVDLEQFYTDILGYFPQSVKRNFQEVNAFFTYMVKNRGAYFEKLILESTITLDQLVHQKEDLLKQISSFSIAINGNDLIADIKGIQDRLNEKYIELAEYNYKREKIASKNKLKRECDQLTAQIRNKLEEVLIAFEEFKDDRELLETYFNMLVKLAYNQSGKLELNVCDNVKAGSPQGRVVFSCHIPDEEAHGRNYMKINMFDLAMLMLRVTKERGITFLVHDGSYSKPSPAIKKEMLFFIDEFLREKNVGQYFVTLNTEELEHDDFLKHQERGTIVLSLKRTEDNSERAMKMLF